MLRNISALKKCIDFSQWQIHSTCANSVLLVLHNESSNLSAQRAHVLLFTTCLVPYVHLRLTCLMSKMLSYLTCFVSCSTCSLTSCAFFLSVSWALVPNMPNALRSLVPHVLLCLKWPSCLVPFLFHVPVQHLCSCVSMPHLAFFVYFLLVSFLGGNLAHLK